ncbi:MAG: IS630 family transposase, partial [Methyloglobulus sp.]|nr:IS630 family transposase [Methyloglobulus sp.]
VAAWQERRDQVRAKVNWQFTAENARLKLKRLYPTFDE